MNIEKLKANPGNPRKVTDKRLAMLRRALEEFGDLSGVIFNRRTKQLVGGHQRVKSLTAIADPIISIEKRYPKPTKTGTVAEGYITAAGTRFAYREVDWDSITEKAANIAANKSAGEWDRPKLGEFLQELSNFQIDLDLTMFDSLERVRFFREDPEAGETKKQPRGARKGSAEVRIIQLSFTAADADEFDSIVEQFQSMFKMETTADTVLEILRDAKQRTSRGEMQ